MAFNYNQPPNNIPDAIQWLIKGLQSLQRMVSGIVSGGSGGSGTVTSITAGTGLSGGTITSSGTIALNGVLPTITSVNGIATVGNGIPIIVAQANLRAQGTGVTVLDYTPVSANATYRIEFSGYITTQRINSITLAYTDQNSATVSVALPVVISGATNYGTLTVAANWGVSNTRFFGYSAIFTTTNATHITLTTAISGTPNYDIDVYLIQLN